MWENVLFEEMRSCLTGKRERTLGISILYARELSRRAED